MKAAAPLVVVAAVIEEDGKFLIAQRLQGTHLEGFWEFPGGKVHQGETAEAALAREIKEELGTEIIELRWIFRTSHTYPERTVDLHFFRGSLTGAPRALLGQHLRWVDRADLATVDFPAADAELVANLLHARL